ncbi:serine-rich adhesin for platelets-like [Clytia hemisphaerica]|uniref:serine-rich adhesin for platelets-like n=1 Tax=Clytia hemisphaerica TaxID=252671 RepID=UPI0034D635B2
MEKQLRNPNQNTKRKPTEGSTLPETIDDDDDAFVEETNLTRQRNRKLRPIPQNDGSSSSDELQESDHRHSKRLKRTKELKPKQRTISVLSECEYEQVQHLKEIVEEGIRRYEEYIDSDIELDSELVFKNHVDGVDADLTSDIENAEDEHNIVNVDTFVQDNAQINIKVGDSSVGTSPAGDRHTIHRNLRAENVEIKAEKLGTQNSGDKNVSIINMKESEDRSGKRRFRNKKQGLATRGHEEDENVRIISGKEDDNNCVVMVHEKQTVGGLKVTVTPTFTKTSELEVDNKNKNDLDAGAVTFTKTPELENNRKVDLTGTKVEVKAMDKKEQVSVEKSSLFITGRKDNKDYNVTFQGRDQTPSKRNKVTVNLKAETNSVKSPNVDHSKLNLDLKRKPDDAFSPKVPRKSTKQEPRPSQLNLKGSLNKSKAFDGEEKTIKIKNFTEEVTLRSVKKEPSASSPRKSPMSPTKKRPSLPSPSDPINNIAKKLTTEISSDKTIKDNSNEKNDSKENNVMLEVAPRTVDEGVKFADPTTGSSTAQITGSPLHSDQSKSKINFKVDRKDSSLVPGTGEPSQGTSQQTFKTDKRNNSTSANINSKFSEEDDIVTTSTPTMINYDDSTVTTPSSIHLSSKDELQKVNQEVKSSSEIENKEVLQRDNAPIKLSVGSESTKDTGSQDIHSKPVTDINDSPVARSPSPFSLKSSTTSVKTSDSIDGKSDEKVTEKPSKPDETVKTQQKRSSRRRREEKDLFDIKLKQTVQLNKLDTVDSLTFKARDEVDQRMKARTPSPTVPDKAFTKQETDNVAAHMLSTSSSKADNTSSSSEEIATSKNDSNVSTSTSRSNKQENSLKAHPTQKLTSTSPKIDSEVSTPISTSGKPKDSSKILATSKSPTLLADVTPPEANSEVSTSISTSGKPKDSSKICATLESPTLLADVTPQEANSEVSASISKSGKSKDSSKIRATSKSPTLLADVTPSEADSEVSTSTPKSNKPKDSSKIRATPKQKTLLADVTPSEADSKVSTSTPKSNKPKDSSKIRATPKQKTLLADVTPSEADSKVSTSTPKSGKQHATVALQSKSPNVAASPEDGTKASMSSKSHKHLLSSTTSKQDVQHDSTDEIRGKSFSKSSSSIGPSKESDSKSTLEPQIAVTSNALAHHDSTVSTIDLPTNIESSILKPIADEVTQKSSLKAKSKTESSLKTATQKQVDFDTDYSRKLKKTQGDVTDEPNFKTRVDEGSGRKSFEDQFSIIGIDNGKPDLITQRTEPNDRKAESPTLSFDVPSLPMDIESTMATIDKKPSETEVVTSSSSSIAIHSSNKEHIPTKVELKDKPAHIVEEIIMTPVKSRMVEELPEHLQVLEDTSLHVTSTSEFKDLEEAVPTQLQPNEDLRVKSPTSLDEARSTEKASESQKDSDKEPGEITTINKKPMDKDTKNFKLDLSLSSGSSLKSPITNRRNRFTEQQVKPVNEAPKSRTLDEKRRDTDSPKTQDMEQSSLLKSPSATRRNRFTEQPANPGDEAPNSPQGINTSNIGEVQSLMSLDKASKSPAVDRKPKSKDSSKTMDVEIPSMESADETPKSPAVDRKPKSKDSLKTVDVEIPLMESADETPKSPAVDQKPKIKDSSKTMDVEIPSMEPADETPKSPAVDRKPKSKDSPKTMDVEIPSMEPADETPKSPAVDRKPKIKDSLKTVDVEIPSMESADETPKSPAVDQKPKSNESSKTIDVEILSMEPADETPKSPVVDRRPKSKDSLKTVCMEIPSIEPVDKAPTSPTVDQKPKSNESSKTGDEKQQQSLKSPTTPRKNRFTDQLNKTKPGPKSFIADRTEPLLNKPESTDKETLSSNKNGDKSDIKVPISHEEVLKSPKPEQSPFTKKPASAVDETLTSPLNTVNSEAEIPKSPASPVSKQKLSTESQSNSIKDESSKSQTGSQRLSPENAPKTYKESLNTPIDDQIIRSTEKQENTSKDKNLKPSTFSSGKTTSSDEELIKSPSKRKEEDNLDDEGLKSPTISSRKSASSNEELIKSPRTDRRRSPEKQEDTLKDRNLMSPTISTGTNEELIKSPKTGRRRRRKSPEQRSQSEEEILAAKYESLDQIKNKQLSEDIVQHMEHIMGGIDIALIEHGSRPMHESSGRDSWYKNEGLGDHVAGLLSMVDQFIDEEDHEFNKSYEAIKKSNAQLEKEREKDKTSLSKIAERAKLEKDLSPDYESFSPYSIMKKRNSEQHSSFTFKDVVIGDAGREEKADTVHDDEYCVIELGGPSVDAVSPTKGIAKAERKSVKRSTFIQRLMQSEDKGLSFDDVENVTSGEEERTVVLETEVTKDDREVVADDEKPTIDINKMTLKESSLDPEVSSDCPEKYPEQSSVSNEVNSPTPVEEPKVTGPANSKKIAGDEANRLPLCDEKKTAEPIAEISEPKEKMQQHEVKSKTPDEPPKSSEHVVKLAETKRKINEFQIPISAKEPKAVQSTVESSESKKRSKRSNFIQRLMESEEIQSADENELSDDQMDDDKFLYARREQSVKHLVFDSTGKEVSKKQEQETSQLQVSSQIQDGQEIDESSKAIVTLGRAEPTVLESMANQEVATRQDSLLQEEAINEDVSETKKSTSPMSPKERMLLKQKMRIRQESIDETLDDILVFQRLTPHQ